MKKYLFFFLLLLISYISRLTPTAEAVGLVVRPSEISIQSESGQPAEKEIIVQNPSSDVGLFEIYPDDFESQILPEPASFTLESGESRSVLVRVKFRDEGIWKTNISVVVKPLSENALNAAGGIKIPMIIEIKPRDEKSFASLFSWFGQHEKELVGLVAFLVILYFIFRAFRSLFRKSK